MAIGIHKDPQNREDENQQMRSEQLESPYQKGCFKKIYIYLNVPSPCTCESLLICPIEGLCHQNYFQNQILWPLICQRLSVIPETGTHIEITYNEIFGSAQSSSENMHQ